MATKKPLRILRLPEVQQKTSLSRSSIYLKMQEGGFPKPIKMGRAVGWVESEIDEWIKARIAERNGEAK